MGDIKKLYNYLQSKKVQGLGSEDEFKDGFLNDSAFSQRVYDYVKPLFSDIEETRKAFVDGFREPKNNTAYATPVPYEKKKYYDLREDYSDWVDKQKQYFGNPPKDIDEAAVGIKKANNMELTPQEKRQERQAKIAEHIDANAGIEAYNTYKREEAAYRAAITSRLDTDIERAKEAKRAKEEEMRNSIPKASRAMSIIPQEKMMVQWTVPAYTLDILEDTKELLEAPTKGNNWAGSIWAGFRDNADMKSFLSFGMSTFAKTGKVYDICKRYTNGEALTDEETNLLEALAMNTAVAGLRAGDVSGWYRSGEITGDMVEIMGQFLLTGGIGTGATNVVSKAIGSTMKKVLPKIVSKMGAKGAVGTVLRGAKFAGKGAVDVVAGGAVQSVAMPNTYSGYMEKMSGTVMHGEKEGEYSIEPPDISGLQAWVSSMKETQTERLGGAFAGAGGKILKNIVPKSWGKLSTKGAIGALVKAGGTANKHLAQAGVNGLIGETGEEVAGAVFDRAIRASSDEEWKAFWSKDNMLQMVGGFAPMSILGLGMSGATAANKRVSALRSKRRFVNFTRDIGSKNGVDMAEEIISTPIEDLGKKMHKYTQEIGGYTNGELNDNGIEFNRLAAEVLRSSTERDIANEWDRYIQEQEAEDNVNTGYKRTVDDTVDDTEQTIPQVQQGDEVEYDNARWIVGDVAEEDGEYTFGDESIPLKKGNVLMFEADGNGIRILESTADLYAEDKDNGIESRRQEIYEKYRPVMNVDTGNIIQLSSTADNDNIAYVVKGRVVYDEEGNIDYDKSDDTIYYKVYDKDGNEVDGGTPRPLHLKTHRTEFGKVLSDTPIEEYVDNELYPQEQNNIQQAINNGQTNVEQSTPEESVSTDERQEVTYPQNTILSDEEADVLMSAMEDNAEAMPVIELTPENWLAEFGQNGTVSTPIGDVKMGDNQLAKLFLKKRTREFGMIKPTLINPDVIIEKTAVADNAERNTKLLFVKTFKDENGQKHVHFENVTVQKGGLEVSISSHIVDKSAIRKELANGIVIYNKPELTSIGSDVYLTETHEGQSDLVPTQKANSDLQYKGTTNKPDIQEEFYNSLPKNKKGEIDENRMSAEQKIRYAQIEFGEDLDLVKDYITEQSKALSEKIAKLTNKTGKSVAEYKELATLKADKNVFVDYLHSLRDMQEDSMPRQTVEEAAAKREESRREEQAQREQMVREKEEREGVPDFLQDTPEDARLRGFRLRTGERIDRQEPIEVSKYNTARRKFTNDTGAVEEGRPTVKRTIIDNAQTRLQPSHRGGRTNIYHFITEAQPKERTDKASRVSAAQIAANINPEEITGGITAYNGSPIANNRLEVIQGNNRAEALRLMYEEYPRSAETYKQYLIDNAEDYGMSADEVRSMKEPIAVDIYEGTDGNAILLGQYTQQDVESGGVHRINPSGVVKHLKSHNMLDRFITTLLNGVDEENTVSDVISTNLRDVLPILDKTGAISMTQRQGFFDERGDVTSGAIDDFKGILTSLITEGGYANINSDFLNLPDSAKTALYLQTYRAILNQEYGRQILGEIQDSILLYTLVFGNNNKGKVGVDESRREVMSWLMTAQPDFNTLNEDGTYPLVDMREKFSNFAAELAILYKSTNLRSSKDKGRGLYTIWDDFYNLLEGKGDLFTAGERKSLQESINENFNIDYVPIRQNEHNTLGSRGEASRAGRRGSESELSIGEQSEAGTETADDRGRAEADIAEAVKEIDVEPTEAQKKAGNYKKGHVKIQGFDITIENPKGAIRKGVDDNGKAWSTEMKNHYGYFKNTEGKDGDHIDVFIGDNPNSKRIFVVDQVNPKTKEFDESKVMLGFDTEDEAKKAYLSNYSKDWKGFKDITYVDIDTFKEWLYDGAKQRKPFGEYSNIRLNAAKRKARGATTEKLEELVTLLKKTGFADVKTGEDFYNALAEIEGSERYSSQSEKKLYNPRRFITPVRGEWTKEKIKKRLKESGGSLVGYDRAAKLISEFDSPDELAENIFYHGTVYGSGHLKPSILMSDMDVERYGGGGYGDKYWGISVSRSKKIASNFSGTSKSVSILPIVLAKGAKVKEMPNIEDSADIDDVIVDLWKEGVDAVWVGDKNKGEQELCVINPRAIVNINSADTYRVYGLGGEENPISIINKEGIKKLYEAAKQYQEQKKIAPKVPLKPFRFYLDENNRIGDKKPDDVYDREMKEYEEQLRVYESSDEYKKWQRTQEYAQDNIRFMIGKQVDDISIVDGEDEDTRYMRPNGTVLGFVKGNTIYLNPDEVSLNTPIHEFGHLWVSQVKEHFPELWAKGKELFLESDYLRKVQADPNYRHLDLDGQIDEAMARAIGDRGEQELDKTLLEKILDWIAEVWEKIGGVFGINNLTSEQISNLTLQDFTDMATSELLSGQNLTERGREKPYTVRDAEGEHRVINLNGYEPLKKWLWNANITQKDVDDFNRWLQQHKNEYVRLYHGTSKRNNISDEGIKKTSSKNRKSYQSQSGYVYLSRYPNMARSFGEINNMSDTQVYAVDIKIKDLLPDLDQINNQKAIGKEINNTLAESLIYGGGARVKRHIMPYEVSSTRYNTADETADIKAKAISDGTFMKAPNGKDTNLTEQQWLQVRTKAFKKWFGDWEKTARIEKLKKTKPIEITGEEVKPSDDLKQYKKNALEYGKKLRGEYTNEDTGESIALTGGNSRGGIREILQHDYKDTEHLQSIAAIPQIIEKSIFIDDIPNEDVEKYSGVKSFRYYVCGLKIGNNDYTVKAVVAVQNNGDRYYDHKLSRIEKGKLLSIIPTIQKAGIENNLPPSIGKDKRLFSILQTNSSKVLDENGEPMVVYHGTLANGLHQFNKDFIGSRYSYDEKGFFFISNENIAKDYATSEFDANRKGEVIDAYLSLKNPLIVDSAWCRKNGLGYRVFEDNDVIEFWDNYQSLLIEESEDKDGVVITDGKTTMAVAFEPDQIKSATDNIGTFDGENEDIRYRALSDMSDSDIREMAERNYKLGYLRPNGKPNVRAREEFGGLEGEDLHQAVVKNEIERITTLAKRQKRIDAFEDYLKSIGANANQSSKSESRYYNLNGITYRFSGHIHPSGSMTNFDMNKIDLAAEPHLIDNIDFPYLDDTTNDMVRYSIQANDQLDKEDEIMGKKAAEIYEARVKMGKQMNQSDPNKMPNKKIFDEINRKTENSRAKTAEHAADCYLPMKHFIETLNKHGYNIADYNNWYMNVFALAGKNEAEFEKYQAERSKPLQRAAKAAMDSGQISYRELENYLILKHGQERNKYYKERDEKLGVKPMKDYSGTEAVMFEEFCKRTGIKVKTIEEDIPTLVDGDPNMIRYDNGKSEFSKDGKKIPDFEVNKRFELWIKQHTPEEIIEDYEEKIGKEKVEDLWGKIRKATQFTLDCQKEGGLTSEDMYKKASGMWEYFVPLRGFDMGTAQDEYDYDLNGITLFTDFRVEQTLGRTRRSVSPLAWTEQMAHITIQQKNKNLLNQSLRRLASVSTARKDNIMFLSKQYKAPDVIENGKVVREGALINPPAHTGNPTEDRAAFERWETSMKEGVKNGTVEVVEHSNVNFGMIVSADKVKQHVVRVYEGGRPVDIIFNTSPSVPRAINGLNHKAAISNHWIYKNLQAGTRLMAQTMTTLNPAFVGKNFTRDYLFANTMLLGREDMSYAANFNKNIVKARSVMFDYVRGKSLLGWAAGDKGSVRDNEYGRLLTEFVMNGGKTGFSQMLKFEKMSSDFKKQTEKGDKKVHYVVNDYIHFIEAANDYAENITRFAAYCTSRQAGRSVERSISDAKELTINFNRKGTDGGIWGTVRSLCAFSNASIQALVVFSRGVKANPKRMSAFISGYTAMAITMAVIARLIGGDDDDYFKLSKYDRQNNLCLPMFGGGFVKIPLPQEMRVFYKLGDEIALCILRNEPPEVAAQEVFMGALDLLPSFAAGATSISDVLDEKIGAGDLLLAHQPITIIQPITQLAANRNFLNYRIYDDNKWGGRRKELPEYRKALRNKGGETYSPNFVVKLSEGIGRLTGGSDLKRGVVEVNPDAINHLMRGYFGGLYSSTVAAINMGDKGAQSIAAGEMKMKTTDSPTMKAFYVSPSNLRYTDDILNARYMDVLKEAKKHADVYANYLKEGEVDRFEKETKMTEDEALDWRYLVKGIDKEVQELRNEIATAETTKERDEALRQLEALQREAIDMAAKLKK